MLFRSHLRREWLINRRLFTIDLFILVLLCFKADSYSLLCFSLLLVWLSFYSIDSLPAFLFRFTICLEL